MTHRLLVVSQYWAPAELAGGATSTGRAVASLRDTVETWVVAGDRDVGDTEAWPALRAASAGADGWTERGGIQVRYQRWDRGSGRRVRRAIDEVDPDVIYLPSLFAPGSLAVLWRRAVGGVRHPIVVAPEGELHPGALAHHRGRKQVVLALLRLTGIGRRVQWRAADADEAARIRSTMGAGATVSVAPDLHDPRSDGGPPTTSSKQPGRARIVFMGSIVPKKGLHRALELLWPLRHRIDLDIHGPIVDTDEWARCRALLDRAEPGVRWRAHGPLAHAEVDVELARADLLILPTLGENYGYVIAEALAAGCPVLTSDQTPWRGLATDGCGWDLPLEPAGPWSERVAEVIAWDDDDRTAARHAARRRADRAHAEADSTAGAWRALFDRAISGTPGRRRPSSTMPR
jgi:glycosyltransferase involved in cell wall biosynthesis